MRKGSITIFATLSMILVAAALLSLLEAARFYEIQRLSTLQTELAIESLFAGYHTDLWKEYHVLGFDGGQAKERLIEKANARQRSRSTKLNLFQTDVDELRIIEATRLTDANGAAFIKAVSGYMKDQFAYEILKNLYNQYEAINGLAEISEFNFSKIDEALLGIEMMQKEATEQGGAKVRSIGTNLLSQVSGLQNIGILDLVIQDKSQISKTQINLENVVSNRSLKQGNGTPQVDCDWLDVLLLHQYLGTYFSNYAKSTNANGLSYEQEYLYGGQTSDVQNLEKTIQGILFIRELCNFLFLMSDTGKREEARLLAIALVGVSVNPILIETVLVGILTAWAFCESILDVRALLNGRKIPLLKNNQSWKSQLSELGDVAMNYQMTQDNGSGLSYEQYLRILLLFQEEQTLAMRAMDLQEMVIREREGQSDFYMDDLFIEMSVEIEYLYRPVFLILDGTTFPYKTKVNTKASYSYY